jgi:hypothetical protein
VASVGRWVSSAVVRSSGSFSGQRKFPICGVRNPRGLWKITARDDKGLIDFLLFLANSGERGGPKANLMSQQTSGNTN